MTFWKLLAGASLDHSSSKRAPRLPQIIKVERDWLDHYPANQPENSVNQRCRTGSEIPNQSYSIDFILWFRTFATFDQLINFRSHPFADKRPALCKKTNIQQFRSRSNSSFVNTDIFILRQKNSTDSSARNANNFAGRYTQPQLARAIIQYYSRPTFWFRDSKRYSIDASHHLSQSQLR